MMPGRSLRTLQNGNVLQRIEVVAAVFIFIQYGGSDAAGL